MQKKEERVLLPDLLNHRRKNKSNGGTRAVTYEFHVITRANSGGSWISLPSRNTSNRIKRERSTGGKTIRRSVGEGRMRGRESETEREKDKDSRERERELEGSREDGGGRLEEGLLG